MVRPERLELPTLCSEGRCSIQLSYGRATDILRQSGRERHRASSERTSASTPLRASSANLFPDPLLSVLSTTFVSRFGPNQKGPVPEDPALSFHERKNLSLGSSSFLRRRSCCPTELHFPRELHFPTKPHCPKALRCPITLRSPIEPPIPTRLRCRRPWSMPWNP